VPYGIRDLYHYRRILNAGLITMTAGTPYLAALAFTSAQVNSSMAAFLTQWDLFRFNWIKVILEPEWVVNGQGSTDDSLPMLYSTVNYDDFVTPASLDYVLSQRGSTMRRFTRRVTITAKPRALTQVNVSSGGSGNVALLPADTWLNTGAFINENFALPLVKVGVTSPPSLPGGGRIQLFFELDMTLAQSIA